MTRFEALIEDIPSEMLEGITVVDLLELLVLIIAALVAYWQILLHRSTNKSEHTKDLIMQVLNSDLILSFESKNDIWDKKLSAAKAKQNNLKLNKILNFFENISVYVKNDLVDEALLIETLAPMMMRYKYWAGAYITAVQNKRKNETLFSQFTDLMSAWAFIRDQDHIKEKLKTNKKITRGDIRRARRDLQNTKN